MRKLLLPLALLLVLFSALSAVAEESLEALARTRGLGEADAAAMARMVAEAGSDLTEAERRALLESFLGHAGALQGTIQGNVYQSPLGFSFTIPQGFTCTENKLGAAVLLEGPRNESGFGQTIAVQFFAEEQPAFLTLQPEALEPLFRQTLTNYQFVQMDEFEMNGRKVREFVYVHGASAEEIRMQYQMFFNADGKSAIITMTTLAEEVAHEEALRIYDAFVSELSLGGAQGGGQPSQTAAPAPTAVPSPTATPEPTTRPPGGQGNG